MSIASIRKRFTRKKFQAFLDAQPPRKLAGRIARSCQCPLAVYLGKHSSETVTVGINSWNVEHSGKPSKALPKWAVDFVDAIDSLKPSGHITFGTAAKILRDL